MDGKKYKLVGIYNFFEVIPCIIYPVFMDEFEKILNENQGYIKAMWCGDEKCEEHIHTVTGAKSRCIPFKEEIVSDTCVVCGKKAKNMVLWGRQY